VKNKFILVVFPVESRNFNAENENMVDHREIMPFVMNDFVVKAKKF